MKKKKLKLEIIDPTGNVERTHHFFYEAGEGNRLRLTICDNVYHFDKDGDFTMLTEEEFDKEIPTINLELETVEVKAGVRYVNPETGEVPKLFDKLIPVFTVACTNDIIVDGHKGCGVYFTVEAEDEFHAMDKAMLNTHFMAHMRDAKNFDRRYLDVFKPTRDVAINEVKYFNGDERL